MSSKLNDRDGKLDKTKLQDLAEFLNIYKTAKAKAKNINNSVDLVVEILEDCLFQEVGDISPNKEIEFKALLGVLGNVNQQAQTKDKEIKELAEKCSPEKEQKAIDYLGKVKNAISALKEDLRDNTKISYKILDTIISYTKETYYEAKILTYQKRHRLVDAMACSYLERAIEIIEANGINYKEPKGFASHKEMVDASKKTGWDTNATQYIEYDKKTITTDVINKYDEMKPIAQAQIDAFTSLKDDFENQIKTLCNNNLVEVRKQFKVVYEQSPVELIWRTEKKQTQVNFLNIPLERNWMKMVLLEDYTVKNELNNFTFRELSVEEKSELEQIKAYLSKPIKKRITNGQLRQALGIDIIPTSLVYEWGDIEGSDKFFSNASAIKNVADKVNNLSNKSSFLVYLENNLANDANLPIYPKGS
ncbi:12885_t:CDS:2 [Entrophospora sp. SA101]|nr:12885_t:CDS:2 [Entrophospora sp. SA101]